MVLGAQWSEFGVRVRGEFFLAAEFYEEGEVYCGVAGHDCALVYCDGDCEFGLFLLCSAMFSECSVNVHFFTISPFQSWKAGHLTSHHLCQSTWALLGSYVYPYVWGTLSSLQFLSM